MILKTAHAASKFINYVRRDESSAQVYVRHSVHLKVSTNITDYREKREPFCDWNVSGSFISFEATTINDSNATISTDSQQIS